MPFCLFLFFSFHARGLEYLYRICSHQGPGRVQSTVQNMAHYGLSVVSPLLCIGMFPAMTALIKCRKYFWPVLRRHKWPPEIISQYGEKMCWHSCWNAFLNNKKSVYKSLQSSQGENKTTPLSARTLNVGINVRDGQTTAKKSTHCDDYRTSHLLFNRWKLVGQRHRSGVRFHQNVMIWNEFKHFIAVRCMPVTSDARW